MEKQYTLLQEIHSSANSRLYLAEESKTGRTVVLKTMASEIVSSSDLLRQDHEYKMMTLVDSPYVAKALGKTTIEKRPYLAIRYYPGVFLGEAIESNPLDLPCFFGIAKQIVQGLCALHNANVIHRDVNLSNIMYDKVTGQAVLIDLGVSSEFSREKTTGIALTSLEGSLAYVAPEQTGRINAVMDYRADFYSLGATFFEMLAGRKPFEAESPMEMVFSHIAKIPPDVREFAPDVLPMLALLIRKLLSKMAQDRYDSAEGLLYDLERCEREAEFKLGERDFSRHFEFSRQLFGRERDTAQLSHDYEEVAGGAKILVTVSGFSGVGKTSLVNGIQEEVVHADGLFLSGKFDQYHRNSPYYAFFMALEQFCGNILSASEDSIAQWKDVLSDVLADSGNLLTSKVAGLTMLVEEPAPLENLPPLEERTRFKEAVLSLLKVLATEEHPLALFLDDVHLADMGSMEFLEEIFQQNDLSHLMIVLCYRDNEVDDDHPLVHSLDKIIRRRSRVTQIHLSGLDEENTAQMIRKSFRMSPESSSKLARILLKKTGGNPFYIKQFLRLCHMKNHLYLDMESGIWQWDEAEVMNFPAQESVVEFLLSNMDQIPERLSSILSSCACIGQVFSVENLPEICGYSLEDIGESLKQAVELEIIFLTAGKAEDFVQSSFQFSHDRFQQTFYTALPERERARIHYLLGIMNERACLQEGTLGQEIFEVADHYSKALGEAASAEDLQHMKQILLEAAHRCTLISAFDTALRYLEQLLALEADQGEHEAKFAIAVRVEHHAVLCNLVRIEECDRAYEELCALVQDPMELVDSCCLHITSLSNRGRYQDAFLLGAQLLSQLGVEFSGERIEETLGEEVDLFYRELAALGDDHVLSKQEASDPLEFAISKILYRCCAPGLFYNPLYSFWTIFTAARRIFKYGYTPYGLQMYSNLMVPLIGLTQDFKTSYIAGKAAMQLAEKEHYREALYGIYHLFALHTCHWFEPVGSVIPYARESIKGHAQMGDYEYACFGYFTVMTAVMETASHLDELWSEVGPSIAFANKTGNTHSLGTFYSFRQFCLSLRGELDLTGSFDADDFSEQEHEATFADNKMALCYFHVLRAMTAIIYQDYRTALAVCQKCAPILPYISGFYPVGLHSFLYSLSLCQVLEQGLPENSTVTREEMQATLEANQAWLFERQKDIPNNFSHFYTVVEAERACAAGRVDEALRLYDKALLQAENHEGLLHHAIICNVVARRYEALGVRSASEHYYAKCYQLYRAFGAEGKLKHIRQRCPWLSSHRAFQNDDFTMKGTATFDTLVDIDINAVSKASLAISEELQLEGILEKLVSVLLENAGAQDVYYISITEDGYVIQAEGHTAAADRKYLSDRPASEQDVAFNILQYVGHSLDTVILDNAAVSSAFGRDEHVQRCACKSILCMPVVSKGELKGILYLENNLATGVFDARRKEILMPIAAQLAISLENAYLYEHLRFLVDERTHELQEEIKVRKKAEETLARMANYDPLTGLPNRRLFHTVLSRSLLNAKMNNQMSAVLFVDLDGFKAVNDTYGHEKGDVVLAEVAARLEKALRTSDTVSRMGGDEFVLILNAVKNREEIVMICERILSSVGESIALSPDVSACVTPSIGVSVFPQDGEDAERLINLADSAMYHAKRNNKNQYVFFDETLGGSEVPKQ